MSDDVKNNLLFSISPEAIEELKKATDFGALFAGCDPKEIREAVRSLASFDCGAALAAVEGIASQTRAMVAGMGALITSAAMLDSLSGSSLAGEVFARDRDAQDALAAVAGLYRAGRQEPEIIEAPGSDLEM